MADPILRPPASRARNVPARVFQMDRASGLRWALFGVVLGVRAAWRSSRLHATHAPLPGLPGVTFEEARQIVAEAEPDMVVDRDGFEDAEAWHVLRGPRAQIVDGDESAALVGQPAALVNKATGLIELVPVGPNLARLSAMRAVARS
ncbi:hypothetical protein ACFM35_00915 [Microbacterium sp. P01]|uniref:hypothetical protein n=1 Tax=Microbacterium sp. P01 TaxID=3366261 RepID=UPI00366F4694